MSSLVSFLDVGGHIFSLSVKIIYGIAVMSPVTKYSFLSLRRGRGKKQKRNVNVLELEVLLGASIYLPSLYYNNNIHQCPLGFSLCCDFV